MKWLEVIKYEGDNDALIWKHDAEDFNTSSTLIVHESQEAVFMKNGQIADVFTAGRYVLKTENIPLLRKLINIPTGGESTFHCEVYFINKVEKMAMKWGTDSKIQFIEPTYNFPMEIGASGEMSIQIADSSAFLTRIVGTENFLSSERLIRYFRALLMNHVKSYLARAIKEQQLNIFEIDSQLDVLSKAVKAGLDNDFAEYGINLKQFFITTVVRPDDDPAYRKLKEVTSKRYTDVYEEQTKQQLNLIKQQTESQMRIIEAQSLAEKRRIEGYTYQDERSFDVAEKVASNEGVGEFATLGIGMGVITGVGQTMGNTVGNIVSGVTPIPPAAQMTMPQVGNVQQEASIMVRKCVCGADYPPNAKFCPECGKSITPMCKNCGYELSANIKFCPECGTPVKEG